MRILKCFSSILLISVFFNFQNIFCQIIDNYIIMDPYQNQYPAIGRAMGGATVALPDSVPIIFDNPASLGHLRQIKAFISLHTLRGKLNIIDTQKDGLKSQHWNNILTIGTVSVSLPFHLLYRPYTVAVSYNGAIPYDYEIGEDYFSIKPKFSGQLRTTTVGLGTQLSSTFRIGFGWTHWFGKRKWIANYPRYGPSVEKTSTYTGDLFHMGIQKYITKRLALGTVFYFPFQLSINHKEIFFDQPTYRSEYISEQRQKFSGALRIGFSYELTSSLKFGFDYGYQRGFTTKMQLDTNLTETSYSQMSSISGGLEYNFYINKMSLPVYLIYKSTWLPEISDDKTVRMFFENFSPQFDKNPISHIIEIGGNIRLHYFTIYLATQWKQTGKYMKSAPPIT